MAIDLNDLARLFQATNHLAEAEPLMRRALAIWEASLPDHHPSMHLGRRNLEALLAELTRGGRPGRGGRAPARVVRAAVRAGVTQGG